ncbi:hypothetical protein [Ferruginibacter sp.]
MKKLLIACCIVAGLASCNNYGTKLKIEGTKSELYYKSGITETEAKNTGDFLKKEFIGDDRAASMQLTKDGDVYTLRLVYDKTYYTDSLKNGEMLFKTLGYKASKDVFGGKKVTIALADENMKDFKVIPYDESIAKIIDTPADPQNRGYDHDSAGGVNFYWKDISDDESKTIADYIVKNGAFSGGKAEIYMNKEDGRYVLRFPMLASALTSDTYISMVDKVSKEIKENVFADKAYSFIVTDDQLATVRKWDY